MKALKSLSLVALLMVSGAVYAASGDDLGFYATGSLGVANTKLDTKNTVHSTEITSDSTNKLAYQLGVGYRFHTNVGAELTYINFGKPTYDLRRGGGEESRLEVKNTAIVASVVGYIPLNEAFTLTGKVGAAFVKTKLNRVGDPANDDTYSASDNQVHATYGIGALYKVSNQWSITGNLDNYPKISRTNDNATDTDAWVASVGVRYKF